MTLDERLWARGPCMYTVCVRVYDHAYARGLDYLCLLPHGVLALYKQREAGKRGRCRKQEVFGGRSGNPPSGPKQW